MELEEPNYIQVNNKEITNSQIYDTLKNNDNKKIIYKVIHKYGKLLDNDDVESIKLAAVWRCLKKYDETKSKFLTYLYNCTRWECSKTLRYKSKSMERLREMPVDNSVNFPYQYEILEHLTDDEQNLIVQRYIYKKTLREIGSDIGLSSEGVRRKINKIKTRLKNADN